MIVHRAAVLVAAGLLLGAAPSFVIYRQTLRLRRQVSEAQAAAAQWERRYTAVEETAALIAGDLRSSELKLSAALAQPERGRKTLREEATEILNPATPVFLLQTAAADPVNHILVPLSAPRIMLSVRLANRPGTSQYRGLISTPLGRVVWTTGRLQRNDSGEVGISLSARLLRPGNYLLTLEQAAESGGYAPVGVFPFRLIRE